MVVDEDLVARPEVEGPQDGTGRDRGVRDEGEIVRVGADERRDDGPRLADHLLELAPQEIDRVPLEAILPLALGREDGRRTGAERAVIEKRDRRIESPPRRGGGGGSVRGGRAG